MRLLYHSRHDNHSNSINTYTSHHHTCHALTASTTATATLPAYGCTTPSTIIVGTSTQAQPNCPSTSNTIVVIDAALLSSATPTAPPHATTTTNHAKCAKVSDQLGADLIAGALVVPARCGQELLATVRGGREHLTEAARKAPESSGHGPEGSHTYVDWAGSCARCDSEGQDMSSRDRCSGGGGSKRHWPKNPLTMWQLTQRLYC